MVIYSAEALCQEVFRLGKRSATLLHGESGGLEIPSLHGYFGRKDEVGRTLD
jgi:hypothetical protein